ncbi:VWA domain-containing protein [bacterium]|nr:VWA domain-containing protein [bacterium]
MKKYLFTLTIISIFTTCCAFGAKYQVTRSGVIKTSGQVVSSPANAVNQNYYNNFNAQNYVDNNIVNAETVGTIEIVMDFSGSMSNWIGVAKRSMTAIVSQIPSSTKLGFRVFGHDNYGHNPQSPVGATVGDVKQIIKKGNKIKVITKENPLGSTTGVCSATMQVSPIASANAYNLINGMNSVSIGGATPLVYALDRTVYQDFAPFDQTAPKKIVLITDGGENCGGDPCEFARRLMQKRSDVHIDVVLVSSHSRALTCLASTTGGHFYNIDNLYDFSTTINQSIQSLPTEVNSTPQNQEQHYEFVDD